MYLKSLRCTVCCVCWVGCEARRTKFQSLRIKVPAPPMTARRINLNLNKMNYIYIHITLAGMGEERATGTEYQFQNFMHYFTFFNLDLVPFFLFWFDASLIRNSLILWTYPNKKINLVSRELLEWSKSFMLCVTDRPQQCFHYYCVWNEFFFNLALGK